MLQQLISVTINSTIIMLLFITREESKTGFFQAPRLHKVCMLPTVLAHSRGFFFFLLARERKSAFLLPAISARNVRKNNVLKGIVQDGGGGEDISPFPLISVSAYHSSWWLPSCIRSRGTLSDWV